jgi:hypothetical protein
MANDSSLLPTVGTPPGQATLYTAEKTTTIPDPGGTVTTTDIEFDYSDHLDRIVTALEQMSLSMAFIADKIDNISDKVTSIAESQISIDSNQTSIASSQASIANSQSLIEAYQEVIKNLAEGNGMHIKGQYDWLSMAAIYKLFVEQNVDFNSLKSQVDGLPKENGFT